MNCKKELAKVSMGDITSRLPIGVGTHGRYFFTHYIHILMIRADIFQYKYSKILR